MQRAQPSANERFQGWVDCELSSGDRGGGLWRSKPLIAWSGGLAHEPLGLAS